MRAFAVLAAASVTLMVDALVGTLQPGRVDVTEVTHSSTEGVVQVRISGQVG
jgi:hypothetical protein